MQLSVAFTDSGFPDVSFTATEKSTVREAIEAAAEEWDTDAGFFELSFAGEILPSASRLVGQCGVEPDSRLEVSLVRCVGKKLLMNAFKNGRKQTLLWLIKRNSDQTLRLDTPTFADENGLLAFDADWIPREGEAPLSNIRFAEPDSSVVSVAPNFLLGSRMLASVDLVGLQHVTTLGDRFLAGCESLTAIDFSTLPNIVSIGGSFLRKCCFLTTIKGLSNVTSIGERFLAECSSLESVDLGGLSKITEIKASFLSMCSTLETISNMSALSNVVSVDEHFLSGCLTLDSVDLGGFSKITRIPKYFLLGCFALNSILNISGLRNVNSVEAHFLRGCRSLTPINASVPGWKDLSGEVRKVFEEIERNEQQ